MRVLYAALRHDPRNPILSSSVDYGFYTALLKHAYQVEILGPYQSSPMLPERILQQVYRRITGKKYIKWDFQTIWQSSVDLNRAVHKSNPDIVFSIFPAAFALYKQEVPAIFVTDLTFEAWQEHGAEFGRLPLKFLVWLEHQAVERSACVIAHSQWGKQELINRHQVNPDKIEIIPLPAALPKEIIPNTVEPQSKKKLESPLRLLLVGRVFHRKGIDIAIDAVKLLNEQNLPAELTVCGVNGDPQEFVRYEGPYRKDIPEQLERYTNLYSEAHFLIHPARFEPAGIVPSEAAAFGTPTITNDTGGLATTVKHDVSGIVLPNGSSAQAYVDVIKQLFNDPERYYALCVSTRQRYDRELNWDAASDRLASIIQEVVTENRNHG